MSGAILQFNHVYWKTIEYTMEEFLTEKKVLSHSLLKPTILFHVGTFCKENRKEINFARREM